MSACGICFEIFSATLEDGARVPVVAPCGHTVCLGCARSLDRCAFCRSPFPLDPAALPRNYQLLEALDFVSAPETTSSDSAEGGGAGRAAGQRQGASVAGYGSLGRSVREALVIPPGQLTLSSTVLGAGGTGKVVLGEYEGREVAVKLLDLTAPPAGRRALEKEVVLLARASASCRHVVRLLGVSVVSTLSVGSGGPATASAEGSPQLLALVMPVYRCNLTAYITEQPGGAMQPGAVLLLAQDLLRGLAELHALGITMADLKPDNVLLDQSDVPLLCDFGISSAITTHTSHQTNTSVKGTFNYMSPEQFDVGSQLTPQVDMWALGCTLVHALTGQPPWAGNTMMQIVAAVGFQKRSPSLPSTLGVPQALLELLGACFRADPTQRPSASAALQLITSTLAAAAARPQLEGIAAAAIQQTSLLSEQLQQQQLQQHHYKQQQGTAQQAAMQHCARGAGGVLLDTVSAGNADAAARSSDSNDIPDLGSTDQAFLDGGMPLHMAARCGHTEAIKVLLAAGADKDTKDKHKCTPLHLAAAKGHTEAVKVLLAAGADKDVKNRRGRTPLHLAAWSGQMEVVKVLVAAGANKDARDQGGRTPLHEAAHEGHTEAVKVLLAAGVAKDGRNTVGDTPLHEAAKKGHTEAVKVLLAAGADKDVKNEEGDTPLHWAAWAGHTEAVKVLLAAGADKDVKNRDGETPLIWAAEFCHMEAFNLLLAAGADKDARNKRGCTPLHWAAWNGQMEAVKVLLAAGVARDVKNGHGSTPLHWAAKYDRTEAVKVLLAAGAAKDMKNEDGWTPLHEAARRGSTEAVKVLLAAGAAKDVKNNDGRSPLELAKVHCHQEAVEVLRAA